MTAEEAEKFRGELESLLRAHGVYLTAGQHGDGIVLTQVRADHEVTVTNHPDYRRMVYYLECETNVRQEPPLPSQEPGRIGQDTPW